MNEEINSDRSQNLPIGETSGVPKDATMVCNLETIVDVDANANDPTLKFVDHPIVGLDIENTIDNFSSSSMED